MTTNAIDLWRYLIAETELDSETVAQAKRDLAAYDRARDLDTDRQAALQNAANAYQAAHREAPDVIAKELRSGKKSSITSQAAEIQALDVARAHAELEKHLTHRTLAKTETTLETLFTRHRDELIRMIAHRRALDLGAFGYTDAITREIATIWKRIQPILHDSLDEALGLPPDFHRLPLVIDWNWPRDTRASIAWIWKQIADDRWEWAPPRSNSSARPDRLRITAYFTTAPEVPQSPRLQTTPRLRFGAST